MGKSVTIHCIGETKADKNGRTEIFYAMNSLEVLQQIKKNPKIHQWIAQTKTGEKILKLNTHKFEYTRLSSDFANNCKTKVIKCVCKKGCFICNGSGITTSKHLNGFQDDQIKRARTY